MEKELYAENAKKIIDLAEGMTHAQWNRLNHLIEEVYRDKEAKATFEKPRSLDLLMKQNLIC